MLSNEDIKTIQNLYKEQKYEQLIDICEEFKKSSPDDENLLNTLGLVYLLINNPSEAKNNLLKSYKIKKTDLNCLYNLSLSLTHLYEYEEAYKYLNELIAIDEGYKDAILFLAQTSLKLNKISEAIESFRIAIKYNELTLIAIDNLVKIFTDRNQLEDAKKVLDDFLEKNPSNLDVKYRLCRFYSKTAEQEKVELLIKDILDEKEDYYPIFKILALTRTFNKNDSYILLMSNLLKNTQNNDDKVEVLFCLAKAMDDIKDYHQAAKYLKEANLLHRNSIDFNLEQLITNLANYKNIFSEEFISNNKDSGFKNNNVIFILGLPRSGSTLVEQILGNHKEVFPLGETDHIPNILREKSAKWNIDTFNDLYKIKEGFFKDVGESYFKTIKSSLGHNKYIIDKTLMPATLGLIKLSLPGAKIILCKRNAKDHCLSMYQHNLFNHPYTFSEQELAIYYNNYLSLQEHYLNVFKNQIHVINYEDLASSPKINIERLLEYCELSKDDNCFNFHNNNRFVDTLSSNQVRKPMYKTSINKWDNYKDELKEIERIIDTNFL